MFVKHCFKRKRCYENQPQVGGGVKDKAKEVVWEHSRTPKDLMFYFLFNYIAEYFQNNVTQW